ncbi:MAG: sensor histidine kinase [Aeromicrobium sp.]
MVEVSSRPWRRIQGQHTAWQREYHRVLGVAAALVFTAGLVIVVGSLIGDPRSHLRPGIWIGGACYVVGLVLAVTVMRSGPGVIRAGLGLPTAIVALVAGSSITWSPGPAVSGITDRLVPVNGLQAFQAMCLLSLPSLRAAGLAISLSVPLYLWLTTLATSTALHLRVDQALVTTGTFIAIAFGLNHLRRNVIQSEALQASRVEGVRHRSAELHAERALDEVRRLIHDRIIGTLRIIEAAQHGGQTARACASVLSSLRAFEPIESAARLREELGKKTAPVVTVSGDWTAVPPSRVVTAFREAAGEASRNAAYHGGVDQVDVELSDAEAGQVILTVRDQGVGFDVERVSTGFGVAESIHRRMEEVGGNATIASQPGLGTTVTLTWPRTEGGQAGRGSGLLPAAGRSRLYLLMALPGSMVVLYLAFVHDTGHPVLSLLLAGCIVTMLLGASWLVGRQRPRWREIVGLAVANTGFTIASVAMAQPNVLLSSGAWVIPAVASLIAMVSLECQLSQALLLAVVQVATIVGLTSLDPAVGPLGAAAAVTISVTAAVVGFVCGSVLRHGARHLAVESALTTARAEETGWVQSVLAARSRHLSWLTADIEPFLRGIAEGSIPIDDAARGRAAALVTASRDDLNQFQPVAGELRGRINEARARGVVVNMRPGALEPPAARFLLAEVLAHVPSAEAVTVLPAAGGRPARVTVVPQARQAEVAELETALGGLGIATTANPRISTTFSLMSPELVTASETAE